MKSNADLWEEELTAARKRNEEGIRKRSERWEREGRPEWPHKPELCGMRGKCDDGGPEDEPGWVYEKRTRDDGGVTWRPTSTKY